MSFTTTPFGDVTLKSITRNIAVLDLDNCISNDGWRQKLIDHTQPFVDDRYARYHAGCESDVYENGETVRFLQARYEIIIFTARPELMRAKTARWLNRWRVPVAGVLMRPQDNRESSPELKRSMLRSLPFISRISAAYDDRDDVLKMYQEEQIPLIHKLEVRKEK